MLIRTRFVDVYSAHFLLRWVDSAGIAAGLAHFSLSSNQKNWRDKIARKVRDALGVALTEPTESGGDPVGSVSATPNAGTEALAIVAPLRTRAKTRPPAPRDLWDNVPPEHIPDTIPRGAWANGPPRTVCAPSENGPPSQVGRVVAAQRPKTGPNVPGASFWPPLGDDGPYMYHKAPPNPVFPGSVRAPDPVAVRPGPPDHAPGTGAPENVLTPCTQDGNTLPVPYSPHATPPGHGAPENVLTPCTQDGDTLPAPNSPHATPPQRERPDATPKPLTYPSKPDGNCASHSISNELTALAQGNIVDFEDVLMAAKKEFLADQSFFQPLLEADFDANSPDYDTHANWPEFVASCCRWGNWHGAGLFWAIQRAYGVGVTIWDREGREISYASVPPPHGGGDKLNIVFQYPRRHYDSYDARSFETTLDLLHAVGEQGLRIGHIPGPDSPAKTRPAWTTLPGGISLCADKRLALRANLLNHIAQAQANKCHLFWAPVEPYAMVDIDLADHLKTRGLRAILAIHREYVALAKKMGCVAVVRTSQYNVQFWFRVAKVAHDSPTTQHAATTETIKLLYDIYFRSKWAASRGG